MKHTYCSKKTAIRGTEGRKNHNLEPNAVPQEPTSTIKTLSRKLVHGLLRMCKHNKFNTSCTPARFFFDALGAGLYIATGALFTHSGAVSLRSGTLYSSTVNDGRRALRYESFSLPCSEEDSGEKRRAYHVLKTLWRDVMPRWCYLKQAYEFVKNVCFCSPRAGTCACVCTCVRTNARILDLSLAFY